jgi:hypothetical protein
MKVVWLLANSIAAAWFSQALFWKWMFITVGRKWGYAAADNARFVLLGVLFMFHGVLAVAVASVASVNAAVIITSVLTFAWAQSAYFLLQRFAGPMERPRLVSQSPAFYPLSTFVGFAANVIAFVLFVGWPLVWVPLLVWGICGFVCAEIAIRRYMCRVQESGSACDRALAIFAVNEVQGRRTYRSTQRYPFP